LQSRRFIQQHHTAATSAPSGPSQASTTGTAVSPFLDMVTTTNHGEAPKPHNGGERYQSSQQHNNNWNVFHSGQNAQNSHFQRDEPHPFLMRNYYNEQMSPFGRSASSGGRVNGGEHQQNGASTHNNNGGGMLNSLRFSTGVNEDSTSSSSKRHHSSIWGHGSGFGEETSKVNNNDANNGVITDGGSPSFGAPQWQGMGFPMYGGPFSQQQQQHQQQRQNMMAHTQQQQQYPSFQPPSHGDFLNGSPFGISFAGGPPPMFSAMGHPHYGVPPFMSPQYGGAPPSGPPPENALDVSELEQQFQSMAVKSQSEDSPSQQPQSTTLNPTATNSGPQSYLDTPPSTTLMMQQMPNNITNEPTSPVSEATSSSSTNQSTAMKKRVQKLRFGRGRPRIEDRFIHEPQGKFLPSKKVTKMVNRLFKELKPDDPEVDKKNTFISSMRNIIQRKWSHAEIHVFGSSRSGLSLKGNADVDLCMVIDYKDELEQRIKSNEERFLKRQIEKQKRKEQREIKKQERLETSREYLVDYAVAEDMDEISPVVEEEIFHEEDSLEYTNNGETPHTRRWDMDPQDTLEKKRPKLLANSLKQMQKEYINQLTQLLRHRRMNNVKGIFTSRVPIVKFVSGDNNYQCDICVNNVLGIVNSDFLKAYGDIDNRVRPLAYCIKYWSKKRNINDARNGSLSSYGYVLLLLHYLQNTSPPVLPVLHDVEQFKSASKIKQNVVVFQNEEYDCTYFHRVDLIKHKTSPEWKSQNQETTGSLLAGFFRYYSWEFDFDRHAVSVRTRDTITKQQKTWTAEKKERSDVCIEDPFERAFNVGRCVWKQKREVIIHEMVRAYYMLNDGADFKSVVCVPVQERI